MLRCELACVCVSVFVSYTICHCYLLWFCIRMYTSPSPCLCYFIQSEIIEPNSAPHCNFTPPRDTVVRFYWVSAYRNITSIYIGIAQCSCLPFVLLFSGIQFSFQFVIVPVKCNFTACSSNFYRKAHPIYCFMS